MATAFLGADLAISMTMSNTLPPAPAPSSSPTDRAPQALREAAERTFIFIHAT